MSEAEFLKRYEALCREAFMFIESEDDGTPFIAGVCRDTKLKWTALDAHLRDLKESL